MKDSSLKKFDWEHLGKVLTQLWRAFMGRRSFNIDLICSKE